MASRRAATAAARSGGPGWCRDGGFSCTIRRIAGRIADLCRRRDATGLAPLRFGVAAYTIVRSTEREARRELERITNVASGSPGYGNYTDWIANTRREQRVSLEEMERFAQEIMPLVVSAREAAA